MDEQANPILQPLDPVTRQRHEKTKRELERRKLDRCKVHNPTNKPFTSIYNGYAETLNAHTEENHMKSHGGCYGIFYRYIAEPMTTRLIDYILMQRAEQEVKKINKYRDDNGQPRIVRMDKNEVFARPEYALNDIANRRPLMALIWGGVVEEFGMNQAIVEQQRQKMQDTRPTDEQLFDEIDKQQLNGNQTPTVSQMDNLDEITAPAPPRELEPDLEVAGEMPEPSTPPVTVEKSLEDLPAA